MTSRYARLGGIYHRGGATTMRRFCPSIGVPCVCALSPQDRVRNDVDGGDVVREGETISIDGSTGEVFVGELPRVDPEFSRELLLRKLLSWADDYRRLGIYANADYPADARRAREYGAQGVGLCRTEHMFFQDERLPIVQAMILSEPGSEEEAGHLAKLQEFQHDDFYGIFKAMDGQPVIIRLLDPPLHEFMPDHEQLALRAAGLRLMGDRPNELERVEFLMHAVENLREFNPMLGLRGVRLGILRPAISAMQVRALFEAACQVKREGVDVQPEIMIAVTSDPNEVKIMRELVDLIAVEVMTKFEVQLHYKVGTMIELPRAAILADKMAEYSEFFSFGTNDRTQTTFGISRDDAEGKFLLNYVEMVCCLRTLQVLDPDGVGYLISWPLKKAGRPPDIEVGICGEHGGDPKSIAFCHSAGLNYVSCSPSACRSRGWPRPTLPEVVTWDNRVCASRAENTRPADQLALCLLGEKSTYSETVLTFLPLPLPSHCHCCRGHCRYRSPCRYCRAIAVSVTACSRQLLRLHLRHRDPFSGRDRMNRLGSGPASRAGKPRRQPSIVRF